MTCICIKDRFGDVHARRIYGEAVPEICESTARELAHDVSCDDGEVIKVGMQRSDDPGFARLQDGFDYCYGGICWLYEITIGKATDRRSRAKGTR
jgi:hypothetical protein